MPPLLARLLGPRYAPARITERTLNVTLSRDCFRTAVGLWKHGEIVGVQEAPLRMCFRKAACSELGLCAMGALGRGWFSQSLAETLS